MLLTHLSPPPAVSVPLCKGPNCCTSLGIKLPTPLSQNNPQGCHYSWLKVFSLDRTERVHHTKDETVVPILVYLHCFHAYSRLFVMTASVWWFHFTGGSSSCGGLALVAVCCGIALDVGVGGFVQLHQHADLLCPCRGAWEQNENQH